MNALNLLDATYIADFDILIFTETFLKKPFDIPGFYARHVFASQKEAGRPMRGISVYFNAKTGNLINVQYLNNFIILNFEKISIVACYLIPNLRPSTLSDELLSTLKHIANFKNLIFAGDFNCRLDKDNKKIEALLDFMEVNDLTLVNESPYKNTYVCNNGASVIDLIFRGTDITVSNFSITDTFLRKHRLISVDVSYVKILNSNASIKHNFKFDETSLQHLVDSKYKNVLNADIQNEDVDNFYENMLNLLKEVDMPKKKSVRVSQPWFDAECYNIRKELMEWRECLDRMDANRWNTNNIKPHFVKLRKEYKALLVNKKQAFVKIQEEKILKEAESNKCYKILSLSKRFYNSNNIMMNEWEQNFEQIFNERKLSQGDSLNLRELLVDYDSDNYIEFIPLLHEEVSIAIKKMKNGKAPGPDGVKNENLKMLVEVLLPEITEFLNLCVKIGTFPVTGRESKLKLLYKGKGDAEDTNSYRGICVSSAFYNLLDRVMHARIYSSLIDFIPRNQYGFVKGKSTITAVQHLVQDINNSVYGEKTPLFGLFLDVKKAFDSVDRPFIFKKLIDSKKLSKTELNYIAHNLDLNFMRIVDGVTLSKLITQSNGVRQGGCTSPFLFNFSLADINEVLRDFPSVKALFYADDIVLTSINLADLKAALQRIKEYLLLRNLRLNLEKCKLMKFRNKGRGRYSQGDILKLDGVEIERVSSFTYLGIVFQPSGISFNRHVEKRMRAAIFATYNIRELNNLSIETALKLFELKVSPIASYGIEIIWPYLTIQDLENIERVKTRYLKRVLGLSKYIRSRFVYELVDTDLFVSDLKLKFSLPETEAYKKFHEQKSMNKLSIIDEFYETETMTNLKWQNALFADRYVFTRFACHGYHYVFCSNKKFHSEAITNICVCKYCNKECTQYHILYCPNKKLSLREAAKIKFKSN
jgi:Reverse transcriptase (RNA-dependent DNA polymerase)/Endonuclease-reverse transcriptase